MFFSYLKLVNGGNVLAKFKFKTNKKKNKIHLIKNNSEFLNDEIINTSRIEIFSNKKMILDGCVSIVDYQSNYIKLKLKKGNISIIGTNFLISDFENENIIIK